MAHLGIAINLATLAGVAVHCGITYRRFRALEKSALRAAQVVARTQIRHIVQDESQALRQTLATDMQAAIEQTAQKAAQSAANAVLTTPVSVTAKGVRVLKPKSDTQGTAP